MTGCGDGQIPPHSLQALAQTIPVGEHVSATVEPIAAPLVFLATLIGQTKRIKLGTGVLCLPQHHPAQVAGQAALFDHLSRGRFLMGIGTGSLSSDVELFKVGGDTDRGAMVRESIEHILAIWDGEPPYRREGKYWDIALEDASRIEFGVGAFPKPYQKPHPPIAISILSPGSGSALMAGECGWITGTVLGREGAGGTVEAEIAGAAVVFCYDIAPGAPEVILREAAIRLAGWIFGNRPHVAEHEITDPSGTTIKLRFNNSAATANGFRSSGASALLSRYVVRRAGAIGGTIAPAAPAVSAPGTTVMRAGFTDTLPHRQTQFRWIGTVNGVELDTAWVQPASFAFWIPGDLMERIVAVALLRSIPSGTQGERVGISDFGPAEPFTFGNTDGMIRYTPVTYHGAFAVPNDFRAIIGEAR